ncbi:probable cinnamyl alcohol dehydrogenase 1 [Dendrobium catenatum]|uniref:cinnamyl-alcohol dehydrogenase n=1 Tax=Dendrobium catenatum TaxID=906689 RepID=A0A2I0WPC5_9ASPA|nr:probable cinnamyl alcohol dehydrogenase 1 [Dendrobium catenatum]XP_020684335.1 probable cinnamyl alcohol dehydrogenase 1 [Dendrobium catenatum]PKU77512.1 putative cinnamyl alcohol dehydrogenase 1 [Dendrobium catenatum]
MASKSESRDCFGWAARDTSGVLSPYKFNRRALQDGDVSLRITHCGVCYADVVWTRNLLNNSIYPVVPGHEIVGVVTAISTGVAHFKVGDIVGVGTYINSCRTCEYCNSDKENKCAKGATSTFNGIDTDGTITKGGYSSYIVVHQRYCFKIPDGYPPELAAPLLCAGITVYAPMIHHNMNQPGKSLGVIGLGGLGHMAVKYGKAFGLKVVVFSTSTYKMEEALEILGADEFVLSSDEQQMQAFSNSLDFIIDTSSGPHPFEPYMSLLKTEGTLVLVGFPGEIRLSPASLILGSKTISGSLVGGTKDIKEMLEFSAANKIYPKIELIPITYVNEALDRLVKRDVKYRFVIDIENSLK